MKYLRAIGGIFVAINTAMRYYSANVIKRVNVVALKIKTRQSVPIGISLMLFAFAFVGLNYWTAAQTATPVHAAATPEMYFTFSGGTITDYDGVNGPKDVVIPDTIGGVPVTTIASPAYDGGTGEFSGSFYEKGLTSVTMGDGITLIDQYAFQGNPIASVTIGTAGYTGAAALDIGYGNFNAVWNQAMSRDDSYLTSLYLGPVVRSIEASFNNSLLTTLTLPSTIETIYNSFNYGVFTDLTIGASNATISYSFGDNNELRTVDIDSVAEMNFTFPYDPMLESVNINTITGNATTIIDGNGGWALADVAPSLTVDIGTIGGDANNLVEDTPNLTSMSVGTVQGDVGYLVVGWFQNTIADTVSSLSVEIDTVLGSIDGFVQFSPQLTSVRIGNVVGDVEDVVQGDNDWLLGDTSAGVDVQIGSVGGYLESVATYAPNLRSLDIGTVQGDVYGILWGDDALTPADVASSLEVSIDAIEGDIDYMIINTPNLTSLTIGTLGGLVNTLVQGGSSWTSSSALPFDVTVENITGSLDSYVIDDSPTVRSFTVGKPDALITTPLHFAVTSFDDSRSLEYLKLYATNVTIADGTFTDMLIKEITLGGVAPLTRGVFEGNNTRTGEYIRVYTSDLTNPNNYQDAFIADPDNASDIYLAYIVNPTTVAIEYKDSSNGNALAPTTAPTAFSAPTLTDYLIVNNPVLNTADYEVTYSAYYRVGQTIDVVVPSFPGYNALSSGQVVLGATTNNVVTLLYQNPNAPVNGGSGSGSNGGGVTAPNTGVLGVADKTVAGVVASGLAGAVVAATIGLIALVGIIRRKQR